MSLSRNARRLPGKDEPVVQARFTPSGQIYHYICEAAIGDTIRSPSSSQATVVRHGWAAGTLPKAISEARVVRRATKTIIERTIAMNTDYTGKIEQHGTAVEQIERQLKAAKKAAKRARKAERERKAAAAEKARLYAAGIAAFERLAGGGDPTALAAAQQLIAEARR